MWLLRDKIYVQEDKGSFIERTFFTDINQCWANSKQDSSSVAKSVLTDPLPLDFSIAQLHFLVVHSCCSPKSEVMLWWSEVSQKNSDLSTHRISLVPRENIKWLQHFAVRQRRHHRNYGVWIKRVCEYEKHPLTSDSNLARPLSVFCRYFSLFTKVFDSTFI